MALHVYNTLSRARELFTPADPQRVTMYVCGPTVYNYAHIGNARPNVVFDVLARLLRRTYPLTYARNVTDVDDKINAAARAEGVDIGVLTARYLEAFHTDMGALGVGAPDIEPRVTANLPHIIAMIERLIETKHAYEAEGHVLFAVPSYGDYGHLSGRAQEDMLAGARVEIAPYKHDPADFVLWKPAAADDVGWPSPWGRGRPGWHIECSAMVAQHLGETIDIHGGGIDLAFPHHENEAAQSTCAHDGKQYSRYWLHNGLVSMNSEKMSKSVGNVLLVRELLTRYPGETIRLGLLTAHYRQPLDWTPQLLVEAQQKLDRLYGALRDAGIGGVQTAAPAADVPAGVLAALEDDLNTPQAVAELFALARSANRAKEPRQRRALGEALRAGGWLLGLLQQDPAAWFSSSHTTGSEEDVNAQEIDALVAQRVALRAERKYAEADAVRDQLAQRGILIEDIAGGTRWRRARQESEPQE